MKGQLICFLMEIAMPVTRDHFQYSFAGHQGTLFPGLKLGMDLSEKAFEENYEFQPLGKQAVSDVANVRETVSSVAESS